MANLIILAVHLPSHTGTLLGGFVLMSDDGEDCEVAFRRDWQGTVGQEDAEVLDAMEDTLRQMMRGSTCSWEKTADPTLLSVRTVAPLPMTRLPDCWTKRHPHLPRQRRRFFWRRSVLDIGHPPQTLKGNG